MTTYKSVKYNISGADLTGLTAGQIPNLDTAKITTGTLADARISAGSVTQHVTAYDDNKLQTNVALLGFKTAVNGSLAKYNLVDQIVDEYTDATGVDASASTNELLTAGVYEGGATTSPTRTHDADATGVDGDYTWFKWTDTSGTGSYSTNTAETAHFLVIAGGGSGGYAAAAGAGGAGGLRTSYGSVTGGGLSAESQLSIGAGTTYTMTVGDGGTKPANWSAHHGTAGGTSSLTGSDITDITTVGGGVGSGYEYSVHTVCNGGSGGGAGDPNGSMNDIEGTGTAGQGYAGGESGAVAGNDGTQAGGGGGGAAGAGGTGQHAVAGGTGGAGLTLDITGSDVGYAGGGGGGSLVSGGTATHGGGAGGATPVDGTDGTGGGGGAGESTSGKEGGSGVVILRVTTDVTTAGANLTLQSTDTTASTANPDYADMVVLMENAAGTATLNTDIKGYISEDSGVTFTQGTLVDEGTWGTNKKILAFHDLDISAQTGSAMCYKITTHNQSFGSKQTKIHATSIGWKA